MNRKHQQNIYHASANINLMERNVIQINGRITVNVDVSVKKIIYVKKNMFRILAHAFVKIEII